VHLPLGGLGGWVLPSHAQHHHPYEQISAPPPRHLLGQRGGAMPTDASGGRDTNKSRWVLGTTAYTPSDFIVTPPFAGLAPQITPLLTHRTNYLLARVVNTPPLSFGARASW
jgi:hypothetical protein